MDNISAEIFADKIIDFCISKNKKFLFISGNGASGKTELSKLINNKALKLGNTNIINMDEFVVSTKLRKNSKSSWQDNEKTRTGRYSTAFEESYFMQNVKAIIYNLQNGNNYYHWPKKAQNSQECILLKADAIFTIVEGIGSVFLDKENSISIFLKCDNELEIERRTSRASFSNEQSKEDVIHQFEERNSQYRANIEPYAEKHDIILESQRDFSFNIIKYDL